MSAASVWMVFSVLSVASAAAAETIPVDSSRWRIEARDSRVEEYLGRSSLYLENGAAWLDGVHFLDGSLEFDIAFDGERGFMGGMWRVADRGDHEEFYVRPHESGQPDANQYTPAFDGLTCWQLYYGPGYSAAIEYPFDQWIHVKIAFSGTRAEVYVDSENPVLVIPELKRDPQPGSVGVNAYFAPAHFSNVSFTPDPSIQLRGMPDELPAAPEGVIDSWRVSAPFDAAKLEGQHSLPEFVGALEWTTLPSESTGITNLGRVTSREDGDTVVAAVTLEALERTVASIRFGYSDRVRLYLNGVLLYTGDNTYRSRDFRYLGTIGLFDEVPLHLEPGPNELAFAVSESFGGWGILAALSQVDGVGVEQPSTEEAAGSTP